MFHAALEIQCDIRICIRIRTTIAICMDVSIALVCAFDMCVTMRIRMRGYVHVRVLNVETLLV